MGFSAAAGAVAAAAANAGAGGKSTGGAAASLAQQLQQPWMTIGIPTAPRNQDVDYLTTTLEAGTSKKSPPRH